MPAIVAAYLSPPATPRARPIAPAGTGFSAVQIGAALLASALATTLLLARAGLTIDPWARSTLPFWIAGAIMVALRIGVRDQGWRGARIAGDAAEYVAVFTAIAMMGAVTSYPIAALTHGYVDQALHRIDTALHFDWLAWYRIVAHHRLLQLLGMAAYENIYITPAVLLGWYAWHGERREAYRFLGTFWVAAVITLSLFTLMPAVGPFSSLWRGPIPYMPISELWEPDLIPLLRAHAIHVIDLGQLRGLVSAPSFHAAAAVLYIVTIWRIPALRRSLLSANLAMLLATPVEGTHYLADIIIGSCVALVAIAVANGLMHGCAEPVSARG